MDARPRVPFMICFLSLLLPINTALQQMMPTSIWKISVNISPPRAPEAHWSLSLPGFVNPPWRGLFSTLAMEQLIADVVKAARHLVPEATSVHPLRHTFARWHLAQYPGELLGLATFLGHRSLDPGRIFTRLSLTTRAHGESEQAVHFDTVLYMCQNPTF